MSDARIKPLGWKKSAWLLLVCGLLGPFAGGFLALPYLLISLNSLQNMFSVAPMFLIYAPYGVSGGIALLISRRSAIKKGALTFEKALFSGFIGPAIISLVFVAMIAVKNFLSETSILSLPAILFVVPIMSGLFGAIGTMILWPLRRFLGLGDL